MLHSQSKLSVINDESVENSEVKEKLLKVSLVIPAHNEKENLRALFSLLIENRMNNVNLELVLVDDCSSDGTSELIDSLSKRFRFVRGVHRDLKPSFGLAMQSGFEVASGDVIIPLMGDLSDDPHDLPKLIQKFSEGYDVVFGSRFIKGGNTKNYPPIKLIFNRLFNLFIKLIFNTQFKDVTNAFKAYRKEVLKDISIESSGFEICVELPIKAHLMGCRIIEVPVSWSGRTWGMSKFNYWRLGVSYILMATKLRIYNLLGVKMHSPIRSKLLMPFELTPKLKL